jgi:hypothetical protein
MVVERHLAGSDPNIEVTDEELGGESARTVHFKERLPNAPRELSQEAQSVVIHDTVRPAVVGDPTDVTQLSRKKREIRRSGPKQLVVWLESHWVALAIGVALMVLVVCAIRLHR